MRIDSAIVLLCLSATACASKNAALRQNLVPHGDAAHPLFVGTSADGDRVVASTHSDAMNGLAVRSQDLALAGDEGMTCVREMPTGTHVPAWYCRYDKDAAERRATTQLSIMLMRGLPKLPPRVFDKTQR